MAADLPIIGRAARGIYWRQPPPADRAYGRMPMSTHMVDSVLAPPGSGYAGLCAASRVGWCRQVPYRTAIAVPYRNLSPPVLAGTAPVSFVERANLRRRSLNWNEATLLEAARSSGPADYADWDHAMWYLTDANGWMKQGEPIRRDMLLWAAEAESVPGKWPSGQGDMSFGAVMSRLSRDLPDMVGTL